MRDRAGWVGSCLGLVLLAAAPAYGAGFALFEHSGRGLGNAFAGEAAVAEDASTIYYNPAGLTLLSGTEFVSSAFAIIPGIHFDNAGSHLNPDVIGTGPLRGGDGNDAGGHVFIPTFFLAHELTSRVRLGFGVSTPFGLRTGYEGGWVGRYHAISSRLETVNVNPTIAVRVTDWLSVGGGADIEYAKARLTNALDMGSICQIFGAQMDIPPGACIAFLKLRPQSADGFVKVSGDDWNAGYNLGLLFHPSERWRIGLAYRSMIHHTLGGRATFVVPPPAQPLVKISGALVDTDGRASVDLPERVSLSAFQQVTPAWALLADITWTHWARFDELVFRFDNPKQPPIVQPEGWQDSFRYSLGVRYTPRPRWVFRLGTAYDEGAVTTDELRTPRIPDSDRVWIAAGVGYRPFERVVMHLSYAHLFALEQGIDNPDPVTGHILRGRYTGGADIVGIQLTYQVGWPPL
jgi:long-chain fatty acid transport protein